MELLVVTLANTIAGRDADILARVRLIADTVRHAQGLVTSRFYRSRGKESYYLMLTTWEDEESWQRAQERHNPKQLLLSSASELLTSIPDQWLMRYLWGYIRPATDPNIAAVHLTHMHKEQAEKTQLGWIKGLRQQTLNPTLAFALLARGNLEEGTGSSPISEEEVQRQGVFLLNLFSWPSEIDREDFYADPHYRIISQFINSMGSMRILSLEAM